MRQQSFSTRYIKKYLKKTCKEAIFEEMDQVTPCNTLSKVIEPYYPKPKGAGEEATLGRLTGQIRLKTLD